jgi:hypothetical protein
MYRLRASPSVALLVIIMITLTACSTDAMEAPPTPTTVPPTPTTVPPTPTTPSTSFASVETVTLSNTDCVLNANGSIEAGPIIIKATNNTDDFAEFDIWRIPEGHSFDEFEKAIQEAKEQAEAGLEGNPHPAYLSYAKDYFMNIAALQAGETRDKKGDVVPGTYAIVCHRWYPQVLELRPFSLAGPLDVK